MFVRFVLVLAALAQLPYWWAADLVAFGFVVGVLWAGPLLLAGQGLKSLRRRSNL